MLIYKENLVESVNPKLINYSTYEKPELFIEGKSKYKEEKKAFFNNLM
jgi:hypothetical protein